MSLRWSTETEGGCNCGPCAPGLCGPGLITRGFLANTIMTRGLVIKVAKEAAKIVKRLGRSGRRQFHRIAVAASLLRVNDEEVWEDVSGYDVQVFDSDDIRFPPRVIVARLGIRVRSALREIIVRAKRLLGSNDDDDPG